MNVLVAPTEGDLTKEITKLKPLHNGESITPMVSPLPEKQGADVSIYTNLGLFGLQRKHVPEDFIASINDGRLTRETSLLTRMCKFKLIVLEGHFRYYPDGILMLPKDIPGKYTRKRVRGALYSIKYVKGVDYDFTDSIQDTAEYIKDIIEFFSDTKHLSLYTRPTAPHDWVVPTGRDIDLWLLQSFDGIGPALADAIIDHFGGKIPIAWTCTLDELRKVPRLGKKADEIYDQLTRIEPKKAETYLDKLRRLGL
jgi:ERCC4-type nuclease